MSLVKFLQDTYRWEEEQIPNDMLISTSVPTRPRLISVQTSDARGHVVAQSL